LILDKAISQCKGGMAFGVPGLTGNGRYPGGQRWRRLLMTWRSCEASSKEAVIYANA